MSLDSKITTTCYCLKIRRATAAMVKYYDHWLEKCRVTTNQYSLLVYVSCLEGCSVRELADAAELDRSTLARNLKPLYRMGLIVDTKNPGVRNSRIELTEEGRRTLVCATPLWEKAQENLYHKLGGDTMAALDSVLSSLHKM